MVKNMYCIRDLRAGVYCNPFIAENDEVACRMVGLSLRNGDSALAEYPQDYQVFAVGQYDDQSGLIVSFVNFVADVAALKKK